MLLIVASILGNYFIGRQLCQQAGSRSAKTLLALGIAGNIATLGYFKYSLFLVNNLGQLVGAEWQVESVVLPLAISFFTFQQIAYLVDSYRRIVQEHSFLSYCLFVSFFPQLLAGPIVHHKEMMPQFDNPQTYQFNPLEFSRGMGLIVIGLSKKVLIADNLSLYVKPVFSPRGIDHLTSLDAWVASLAYTLQIYFDFSGYSDIAVGVALLFGIRLIFNFDSPYQSASIIDFWRRWHMSLSRFLRDYLYVALGGNRKGKTRRYVNLMLTMLLGGLWHGAGWNFVFWGFLHGAFLMLNHLWRGVCQRLGIAAINSYWIWRCFCRLGLLFVINIAWVFFRAEDFAAAKKVLFAMFAADQWSFSFYVSNVYKTFGLADYLRIFGYDLNMEGFIVVLFIVLWAMVLGFPNSQTIVGLQTPQPRSQGRQIAIHWRPSVIWSLGLGVLLGVVILSLSSVSEFIYFQFLVIVRIFFAWLAILLTSSACSNLNT